jgi:hypothetical protein
MPGTRPLDNIPFGWICPKRRKYAMANLSPYSFCHVTVFPRSRYKYLKILLCSTTFPTKTLPVEKAVSVPAPEAFLPDRRETACLL